MRMPYFHLDMIAHVVLHCVVFGTDYTGFGDSFVDFAVSLTVST